MSLHGVMAWAWKVRGLDPTARIVLMSLASRADNEDRTCYPSIKRLADDCEISESSVKRHLKTLADRKLITIETQLRDNGSHTVNLYRVNAEIEFRHPEGGVQNEPTPVQSEPTGVHGRTPQNYPSELTLQKATPSSGKARKPAPIFSLPSDIPEAEWDAFDEMRRRMNPKAWTERAKIETVNDLRRLAEAGYPPGDVLRQSVQRGWRGVFKIGDQSNDNSFRGSQQRPGAHRRTAADLLSDLRGMASVGG